MEAKRINMKGKKSKMIIDNYDTYIDNAVLDCIRLEPVKQLENCVYIKAECSVEDPASREKRNPFGSLCYNANVLETLLKKLPEVLGIKNDGELKLSDIKNVPCRLKYDCDGVYYAIGNRTEDNWMYMNSGE